MGQMEDLRMFVTVVENNGIARAAEQLRIAKSAVSRRLNLMEERYGARLIDRRPGFWEVTAVGQELYQRAVRMVSEADEFEADFMPTAQSLSGPLTVSVAHDFGLAFLKPALLGFRQRHPEIQLTVDFDDRRVDLERENYDLAIRITEEVEPELATQRLGGARHCLFASPGYAKRRSLPESLKELGQHPLLHYGTARRAEWEFYGGKGKCKVAFEPALNSNSGLFLLEATVRGMGIARMPDFIASNACDEGKLVHVLPDLKVADWGIYLVHSSNRRLNRRMRIFLEEMKAACQTL